MLCRSLLLALVATYAAPVSVDQCATDRCDPFDYEYTKNCCQRTWNPGWDGLVTTCKDEGVIALTFDDGFTAGDVITAERLHAAGIVATFFINGDSDINVPGGKLWGSLDAVEGMGHQVASHTQTHCCIAGNEHCPGKACSAIGSTVSQELRNLEQEYERNANRSAPGGPGQGGFYHLRPPFLDLSESSAAEIVKEGYSIAWLTDDTNDWMGDHCLVYRCLNSIVSQPASGSHNVLQHGRNSGDLSAAYWKQFKQAADKNGWKFVTFDQCVYGVDHQSHPSSPPVAPPTPPIAPTPSSSCFWEDGCLQKDMYCGGCASAGADCTETPNFRCDHGLACVTEGWSMFCRESSAI
ncbi:hypothetical protein EMIHUDRAFT_219676 [Emiliania huxleyi CCMP1516]|uniref:NodB homology domain-containing protein n=2 Tax=Emiliania huxleyi TaxID=2903 RepID=A0A0D3I3X1_EMIH1|nr:hypothetical protein EMIHUDRAFT_219676 [Emiliania huxleyi CCMP1516]EOD05956.1 hypothetical protein EMIHUDRAFT_219676 [Emiliania huxleyi CCMP1516]|eukprot:XP_005758385.1 hypothetical protein EMIHUDRAFT_219676 [Emiliania huxleyi CCMP1516]